MLIIKKFHFFITCILLFLLSMSGQAQVRINEVCAYNGNVIEDEDHDESDWFELYNAGNSQISLAGYVVKDESSATWIFPDTIMQAHQYLLVFASGKNRNFPTLHTSFNIDKSGEKLRLYNASGVLIDEVQTGNMQMDHSAGKFPDGMASSWKYFDSPTPGSSNNISQAYTGYAENPVFSIKSGFYSGNPKVTISQNQPGAAIRYTLDGSIPTDTSALYISSILLDSTRVVRARAFFNSDSILPSEVITNTYFINYTSDLPVISISTNPENLWDWNTGIYVLGPNADTVYPYFGANFWQDWEKPAHIEFFETDQALAFEQDAGLSINGGSVSRTRPQQSFRLTARNKYGKPSFEHKVFSQKNINSFKILVLRNSSGDFNKTHFRDGSLHRLMINHVDIDLLCYRPAAIFLNGKYWGILNIREKFSKYYLQENHQVNPDNVDILEEDSTLIQGNFDAFHAMHDFVCNNDMRVKANYDSAAAMIDIKSFCDYFIAETCLSNIDWPYNNIKYWREREAGKKWRYLLMDLDISLGNNGWAGAPLDLLGKILGPYGDDNKHVQLLKSLLKNQEFKNYFINRYADLVNTLFSSESLMKNTHEVMDNLLTEIPKHFERWGNTMGGWYWEIEHTVYPYINERPGYALDFVRDTFLLKKEVNLTLDVWSPAGGSIHLNTIDPQPLPWSGIYFDGVPVSITAVANPGFTFIQWQSDYQKLQKSDASTITLNVDTNAKFTAYFVPENKKNELNVFPNPANNNIDLGFISDNSGSATIQICNTLGAIVKTIDITMISGPNFYSICTSEFNNGIYFIYLKTSVSRLTSKVLIQHF